MTLDYTLLLVWPQSSLILHSDSTNRACLHAHRHRPTESLVLPTKRRFFPFKIRLLSVYPIPDSYAVVLEN